MVNIFVHNEDSYLIFLLMQQIKMVNKQLQQLKQLAHFD